MNDSFTTLAEASTHYHKMGYTHQFDMRNDHIICLDTNKKFLPNAFEVTKVFRFEGISNPSDSSILFMIETSDGMKGQLAAGFGAYGDQISPEMQLKLQA